MSEFFGVPGKKSTYYAKKFHNIGCSKLRKLKYYEALENLNRSLCLAEVASQEESLAYARRSEIYLEVHEYEKCLQNIQLAQHSGCLKSELETLAKREVKCKELMKDCAVDSRDDPWNFFKLSHPPNKKIPFVANCLELKNDENFGRYISTSKDLLPGDIIAIEEPFFKIVVSSASHLRCSNCLKSNKMNLTPSRLCSSGMFCSHHCQKTAEKIFHASEVKLRCIDFTQRILLEALRICNGSFDKLSTLIEDASLATQTVYDFDWNNADNAKNRLHGLLAFNSLQLGALSDELSYVDIHPVLDLFKSEREKDIAKAFMIRVARILSVNCYSLDWWMPKREDDESPFLSSNKMKIGSALLIFGSLFNHSCAPNIDRMVVDNKFIFIVRRPIKKGEQCFISYGPSFIREPNDSRQVNLKAHFEFDCSCVACTENYPIAFNQPLSGETLTMTNSYAVSTDRWKQELRENCRRIEDSQGNFPCHWLCKLMDRNLYLLAAIARNEPFVF